MDRPKALVENRRQSAERFVSEEEVSMLVGYCKDIFVGSSVAAPEAGRFCGFRTCLLMTNLVLLREQLGAESLKLLRDIDILFARGLRRGVLYLLLDIGRNVFGQATGSDWKSHIALLQDAVALARKRLGAEVADIFIVGDESVIPMPRFCNVVGIDKDVDTDYPYCSLSADDPWEKLAPPVVTVGRLPVGSYSGASVILRYLEHLSGMSPPSGYCLPSFGISTEVWRGASQATFDLFGVGNVTLAPPVSVETLGDVLNPEAQIVYCNLHGSSVRDEPEWYGESSTGMFPKAITPGRLQILERANVIGVEACYGAKFIGLQTAQSCLLSALSANSLGVVGSSRIAFGPADPPIALADVLVGYFLKNVANGCALGEALNLARHELWNAAIESAHARLTLLEFNLFGDPACRVCAPPSVADNVVSSSVIGGDSKSTGTPAEQLLQAIRGESCHSRLGIGAAIRRVDLASLIGSEIQAALERCRSEAASIIATRLPRFATCVPEQAIYSNSGGMKLVQNYLRRMVAGPVSGLSIVHDLETGRIEALYTTK